MEQLGIEPKLLLAQIVNFTIIMVILSKLLYKPILAMLAKRKKEIEEALALTERLRADEEKTAAKREKIVTGAHQEAAAIVDEAKKQAKLEEHEIIALAHKGAEEILVKAREEAGRIKEGVLADGRRAAVDLAVVMAKRLLTAVLSTKEQHVLISRHLKDLETFAKKQ